MSDPAFIHLRVHSAYSLLQGAIRIPELVELCRKHDMPAVGIADHDNLFGSLEFSMAASRAGIQPIIGSCISLKPQSEDNARHKRQPPDQLLLIAKDKIGYKNLLKLSSLSYLQPADDQAPLMDYAVLKEHSEGLICLTGGRFGAVGRALLQGSRDKAAHHLEQLKTLFGDRLYVELMRHGMTEDKAIEAGLIALALEQDIALVATNDAYFTDSGMYDAHDALICVADGRYVSEEERRKLTPEHRFKSPEEMKLLFADIPEALENTVHIAKRCSIFSPSREPILPSFHMEDDDGNVLNESEALRLQATEGLQRRLEEYVFTDAMSDQEKKTAAAPYFERLDYELDVIITMKFPGYFLIVSDFITWAKEQHIPVGPGRGSGAGSVVAWSLLITDLDPLKYGLIFERFLNPERVSMPDFDIDFCQERRDEVIRYVQQKYGHDKVAQIITFGKLQARAVLRDVGRVLQMPYGQVDRICKLVPNNPANPVTLKQALDIEPELKRMMKEDETVDRLVELSLKLEGLYRHASTHAAGVVIADRSLDELVPMYRDPKSDMPVVQYSMKYAEGSGLVKFDFLGLKTLSVLQRCVHLLAERGIGIDLAKLPEGDPVTYEMLSHGDTVGVFQFESAGMQDALRKLKPDQFEDLIALGALYRPGPMDNIPTYIARKHGRETPDYLHPMLEEVLKETYGVIIYQEQVQKIAQIMGGYTLGGADLLRRAMGKKIKAEMDAQREIFVKGALENKVKENDAAHIFDLVAKFAGYGFNKSHAAAYALIAYQTAYLKANYPVEFLAASMAFDMHHTDKLNVFKQEADRQKIKVLPPDINASDVSFSVEKTRQEYAIRYALAAIKNVGAQAMKAIVEEREKNGAYKDIFDFATRIDAMAMNRRQLEHLIMAGAFDSLHDNRHALYEAVEMIIALNSNAAKERESSQVSLFGEDDIAVSQTHRLPDCEEWPQLDKLHHEFDAIGFYLSAHPLEGYATLLEKSGITPSVELKSRLDGNYNAVKVAGIVTSRKNKLSQKGRFAFIGLSDASGAYEVSVFDEALLDEKRDLLEVGQMLLIKADGKVDESGIRLIAQSIEPIEEAQPLQRSSQMDIRLAGLEEVEKLQEMLESLGKGSVVITLGCRIPDYDVRIRLPERYAVNTQAFSQLQSLAMVDAVEWL